MTQTQNPCLFLAVALLSIASIYPCESTSRSLSDLPAPARHELWMEQHGRVYKDDVEKQHRFQIFTDNLQQIKSFNNNGSSKYKLGLNKFADLTHEEFKASLLAFVKPNSSTPTAPAVTSFMYETETTVPDSIDWRDLGAVTPIKEQGVCGSCWAFTTVAATEAITKIKTGKLISLSEQQLLDCVTGPYDLGCKGGVKEDAFQYIIDNGGITTESSYPYIGTPSGTCDGSTASGPATTISGYQEVPNNDEASLIQAVAKQPVSVILDASSDNFRFYKGGILEGFCGTDQNHAVTIVGYGTDPDGTKYWLAKNSWGTTWGENGYLRIQRDIADPQGQCGIAMNPTYPIW